MPRIRPVEPDDRLVDAVVEDIGDPARDLRDDAETELVAIADTVSDGDVVAALLARSPEGWELRTTPGRVEPVALDGLVSVALAHAGHEGAGPVRWLVPAATDDHRRIAGTHGLEPTRTLFQMRCPLPLDRTAEVATRAYDPAADRGRWVEANNRAFAWHPDQAGWTGDDVRAREAEPWFDPAGFLLHEVDGTLAGFCWTKVHATHDPPLGEIYVIAVDPDFQGRGLGRELTLAGLDHLAGQGLSVGMLYVEADNEAAVALYRDLGFSVHHEDVFFTGTVPAA